MNYKVNVISENLYKVKVVNNQQILKVNTANNQQISNVRIVNNQQILSVKIDTPTTDMNFIKQEATLFALSLIGLIFD